MPGPGKNFLKMDSLIFFKGERKGVEREREAHQFVVPPIYAFLVFFFKDSIFRERGREGQRERNINVLLPLT